MYNMETLAHIQIIERYLSYLLFITCKFKCGINPKWFS